MSYINKKIVSITYDIGDLIEKMVNCPEGRALLLDADIAAEMNQDDFDLLILNGIQEIDTEDMDITIHF